MNKYPAKFCLFCDTSTDESAIENARNYIKSHNLTQDDVRITKKEKSICVWTKRDGVVLGG